MKVIGFSGSRHDLIPVQRDRLTSEMGAWGPVVEFHHGDCVGADEYAHSVAKTLGWRVVVHPAAGMGKLRARVTGWDERWMAANPIHRNHDIVDAIEHLIAAPSSADPSAKSGTWATIRYARKRGTPVTIVLPTGELA